MNVICNYHCWGKFEADHFPTFYGDSHLSNDKKRKEEFHSLQLFYPYCFIFFLVEIRSSRNDIAFFHK